MHSGPVSRLPGALLRAIIAGLADMARRGPRSQADLDAVMRRVGLAIGQAEIETLAVELARAGLIADLIPVSFGGFIVRVTAKGQEASRTDCPFTGVLGAAEDGGYPSSQGNDLNRHS